MSLETRIPVSVLVGFLGAGKTTVLNHILSAQHGRKIAVVVNEFGAVNVDARLVRHTTERLVEMSNGCICCTLREDLLQELKALSAIPDLEYILIESTGIGEPMPIAQTFYMDDLPQRVRLDSIITVVDAANFWEQYHTEAEVEDAQGNPVVEPLAPLLVDQIEFSNIILLNKVDVVAPAQVDALESFIRQLNPTARRYRAVRGQVDVQALINTGLYDYETGAEAEGWEAEWNQPSSEADEYGFGSVVFRSEHPLRWSAFEAVLNDWPAGVVRAKGFVAFADRAPILLHQAGDLCEIEELEPANEAGDSDMTEIVFIGQHLNCDALMYAMSQCLAS